MSEPIEIKVSLTREKEMEIVFNVLESHVQKYLEEIQQLKSACHQLLVATRHMMEKGFIPSVTQEFIDALDAVEELAITKGDNEL